MKSPIKRGNSKMGCAPFVPGEISSVQGVKLLFHVKLTISPTAALVALGLTEVVTASTWVEACACAT
jgi:hypothetical protein